MVEASKALWTSGRARVTRATVAAGPGPLEADGVGQRTRRMSALRRRRSSVLDRHPARWSHGRRRRPAGGRSPRPGSGRACASGRRPSRGTDGRREMVPADAPEVHRAGQRTPGRRCRTGPRSTTAARMGPTIHGRRSGDRTTAGSASSGSSSPVAARCWPRPCGSRWPSSRRGARPSRRRPSSRSSWSVRPGSPSLALA